MNIGLIRRIIQGRFFKCLFILTSLAPLVFSSCHSLKQEQGKGIFPIEIDLPKYDLYSYMKSDNVHNILIGKHDNDADVDLFLNAEAKIISSGKNKGQKVRETRIELPSGSTGRITGKTLSYPLDDAELFERFGSNLLSGAFVADVRLPNGPSLLVDVPTKYVDKDTLAKQPSPSAKKRSVACPMPKAVR